MDLLQKQFRNVEVAKAISRTGNAFINYWIAKRNAAYIHRLVEIGNFPVWKEGEHYMFKHQSGGHKLIIPANIVTAARLVLQELDPHFEVMESLMEAYFAQYKFEGAPRPKEISPADAIKYVDGELGKRKAIFDLALFDVKDPAIRQRVADIAENF